MSLSIMPYWQDAGVRDEYAAPPLETILPQLRRAHITHAWAGWVAYTFDELPHLGVQQGIYYCMGTAARAYHSRRISGVGSVNK
jgi:glycine/D-amino acid oxidase-like deaminating enzyme